MKLRSPHRPRTWASRSGGWPDESKQSAFVRVLITPGFNGHEHANIGRHGHRGIGEPPKDFGVR